MPFNGSQQVENRLKSDTTELTPEEVRELMPYMNTISEAGMRRLNAELSLQCLEAVQQFEKSSSRLTWWLIGLTGVLVLLTVVIAAYTVVLARAAH